MIKNGRMCMTDIRGVLIPKRYVHTVQRVSNFDHDTVV